MVESWLHSTGRGLPPLLAALGHEYVLATRDPALYRDHPALVGASQVVVVETNDQQAMADRAARLAAERRIDGVLTTCDYYLPAAAVAAHQLGLPSS